MTTSEENVLATHIGKQSPFLVPEGYFETLPELVMNRIKQRRQRRRIWKWAAVAVMAGCVCTAGVLTLNNNGNLLTVSENTYMEDELDYSMLNNLDIQQYLTVAE